MVTRYLFVMALVMGTPAALADWTLDNDRSSLSFISIKAGDVGEVHRFTELAGSVSDNGNVAISINLASVDTLIPIRDERMRELLFEVVSFPTATLTASVDYGAVTALQPGATLATSLAGELNVKSSKAGVAAQATVARLADDTVLVASSQPIIVTAGSLGLTPGVEKLREIAGLPSISQAVPVSFVLVFVDK